MPGLGSERFDYHFESILVFAPLTDVWHLCDARLRGSVRATRFSTSRPAVYLCSTLAIDDKQSAISFSLAYFRTPSRLL